MAETSRPFRTQVSYQAERITRDSIVPFLEDRGVTVLEDLRRAVGPGESQLISAVLPNGLAFRARVRLCWRRDRKNLREGLYSAFQLRARTLGGDWEKTLRQIAGRDADESISHTLAVQRDGDVIVQAALIPSDQLPAIWQRQREVSDMLIGRGEMGGVRKNHATNGDSPTLWLQDSRTPAAHEAADVLWDWPGVIDLVALPGLPTGDSGRNDDSWNDLPMDYAALGSDGGARVTVLRSSVKRDNRVRRAVIERADGRCERSDCGESRGFKGFLDVHHILGAERGDRVWNCVALCPNCHREAHFSPDSDQINADLLAFASRFEPDEEVLT